MRSFLVEIDQLREKKILTDKQHRVFRDFYENYKEASSHLSDQDTLERMLEQLIELSLAQVKNPHQFSIFHRSIRTPFDYYQFGLDFIRPFIDFSQSQVYGLENLTQIQQQLTKKENVILLANHQTEPDPQIISLMLEKINSALATDMIFVAGHRVITDPMAIPFSLGRNLLCIFSKKHIAHPPEKKSEKILHNQRTLKKMQELLNEGGHCIYVAPSGGRDRADIHGHIQISPFDPQSLELFYLLGKQAEHPTHFYPLALQTYHLMPPPKEVEKELGEKRSISHTPVYIAFGNEIDMENIPGGEFLDKKSKRHSRAEYIWKKVCENYTAFP